MICRVCEEDKSIDDMRWKKGKPVHLCKQCEKKYKQKRYTSKDYDKLGEHYG